MRTIYLIVLLCITAAAQETLYLTKIVAPDNIPGAEFGYNFGYANSMLIVGSPNANRNAPYAGALYVFQKDNLLFSFFNQLYLPDPSPHDYLGRIIYSSDSCLFVRVRGAPPGTAESGVVHYYRQAGGAFQHRLKLKSPTPIVAESFGTAIYLLKPETLLLGSPGNRDSSFSQIGSFYIIKVYPDSLQILQRFDGISQGQEIPTGLGSAFVSSGELLFVSASAQSDSNVYLRGCIYVYTILPDTMVLREIVCSPSDQSYQRFGRTLALSQNRLFVGAPQSSFAYDQGRIYVYDITGDSLKLTNVITAPNSSNINYFGLHMVAKGDSLLVGAPQDSSFGWNHGGIYLFQFDENNNYRLERTITLPDSINIVQFPSSLIMTEEFILAGALYDDESRGAVYMFTKEKPVSVEEELPPPFSFQLGDNYPNPFNPVTRIPYQAATEGRLRIVVYDVLGRELDVLTDEYHPQGSFETVFDASLLSSGIYFYALETGQTRITKKMVLLR